MPDAYLTTFHQRVRDAHSADRCHWGTDDDLLEMMDGANPTVGGLGICDCPAHKTSGDACGPCKCHGCASTEDVLAISTDADADYRKGLNDIEDADNKMALALKKGEEQYQSGLNAGESPAKALTEVTVLSGSGSYWGANSETRKAVLAIAGLKLDHKPDHTIKLVAGCHCACFKAKQALLKNERHKLDALIKEADSMSPQVKAMVSNLTATFWNTAVPVLKGSITTVSGLLAAEPKKVADGAKELLDYYKSSSSESERVFGLLRMAKALSEMKQFAMLGVMYFDQQAKAPTCAPLHGEKPPPPPHSESVPHHTHSDD